MKRIYRLLTGLIVAACIGAPGANRLYALLSTDYQFSSTSGTYTSITGQSGTVTLIAGTNTSGAGGTFNDTASAGPVNIGFTFRYDCLAYTQFSVSTNGAVYLGSQKSGSFNNDLAAAPVYPVLAPWWDHQHIYNNGGTANGCTFTPTEGVHYRLTGTAPNRVLTIEFNTQVCDASNSLWWAGCGLTMNRYQVRLYEGTNKIEYHYNALWASSGQATAATIGIANGSTNFISLTPSGATATTSSVVSNNNIQQHVALIPGNTIFAFTPCYFQLTGVTGLASSVSMNPGDTLLNGQTVIYGNESTYSPFTMAFPAGSCPSHNYTITFSGTNASDYRFVSSGTQTLSGSLAAGGTLTPQITFRPSGVGVRTAFMTFTDNTMGCSTIYYVTATGTGRIVWTGNPAQGGTVAMASGDTLLKENVLPGAVVNRQPFTISNISTGGFAPAANITYTITGGSGQFTITPPNAALGSGQSSTPTITFSGSSTGPQYATLTVVADGQTRTFVLFMFVVRPEASFTSGSTNIDFNTSFFDNQYSCDGEQVMYYPIDIKNTGAYVNDTVYSMSIYRVDSTIQQGIPRYPLLRDQFNNLIPSPDYIFSTNVPVAPLGKNTKAVFPMVLTPGQTVRIYAAFVSQRPNKRYARAFFRTNVLNFASPDTNNVSRTGLMTFDLYARGTGAYIADSTTMAFPKAVVFPPTRIGDSVDKTLTLINTGQCDLRISMTKLEIAQGDIDEITMVQRPTGTIDPSTNDLILAPNATTSMVVRFRPVHVGSRRATIRVQTNDSTLQKSGVIESGAFYWDLQGVGSSNLAVSLLRDGNSVFPPGVIDGPVTEISTGKAEMRNTLLNPITITDISITGPDASDFTFDPSTPVPSLPKLMTPAEILNLIIDFKPASGSQPGVRNAFLRVVLETGDTLLTPMSALAGTRVLSVSPNTLFDNVVLPVGTLLRRIVEVKNTGTLPLTLTGVQITGVDSLAYSITPMARNLLVGGQTEYVEITFKPIAAGTTVAKFEASGNQTNGKQTVTLGGKAVRTKGVVDPSDVTSRGVDGGVKLGMDEKVDKTKSNSDLKFKK